MAKEAVEFRGFGAVFGGRMYKTCKWISYVEGRGGSGARRPEQGPGFGWSAGHQAKLL